MTIYLFRQGAPKSTEEPTRQQQQWRTITELDSSYNINMNTDYNVTLYLVVVHACCYLLGQLWTYEKKADSMSNTFLYLTNVFLNTKTDVIVIYASQGILFNKSYIWY